ncbi:MAG: hypothetical protein A2070_01810 [Bdellovibrionales bacterium GWC1_52_8]|nr:MAG: hypothetical protein A2X97_05330 [Bdellovibrionales bacterium GWA1_52_35]OFZ43068.1 MAG: hypothetical protein A2070_01810 [Bdellovibrionales bacterium GWC1_52_8]HCM40950.1 hypothetical protein [Bdellovibrionales bacterium]
MKVPYWIMIPRMYREAGGPVNCPKRYENSGLMRCATHFGVDCLWSSGYESKQHAHLRIVVPALEMVGREVEGDGGNWKRFPEAQSLKPR